MFQAQTDRICSVECSDDYCYGWLRNDLRE